VIALWGGDEGKSPPQKVKPFAECIFEMIVLRVFKNFGGAAELESSGGL
jgi:hypothetical protein